MRWGERPEANIQRRVDRREYKCSCADRRILERGRWVWGSEGQQEIQQTVWLTDILLAMLEPTLLAPYGTYMWPKDQGRSTHKWDRYSPCCEEDCGKTQDHQRIEGVSSLLKSAKRHIISILMLCRFDCCYGLSCPTFWLASNQLPSLDIFHALK